MMIPPVVGPATSSGLPVADAQAAIIRQSASVCGGRSSRRNFSMYWRECLPDASWKWPSSKAPASRSSFTASVLTRLTIPAAAAAALLVRLVRGDGVVGRGVEFRAAFVPVRDQRLANDVLLRHQPLL